MTPDDQLTTSPMLFGYCDRSGRLAVCDGRDGTRFRLASGRAAEIAAAFLEPRSIASAQQEGFTSAELHKAVDAGILVTADDGESLSLWERNGWSRPAYLLFSQMNQPYREFLDWGGDPQKVVSERRATLKEYQSEKPYPHPKPLAAGESLDLPAVPAMTPRPSALTTRRSIRAFSRRPPNAEQLGGVLHASTHTVRSIMSERQGTDPIELANSRFTWAHLFVVVQDVSGVPPGVFEYDYMHHRLLRSEDPPPDDALLACLQGQRWILGTGFVVFVVADMRGCAWLYRRSRAYIHVLIQAGALGQELLTAATQLGLGGWTTPALHESRTARILGLPEDDSIDALSMVKLGLPAQTPRGAPDAAR